MAANGIIDDKRTPSGANHVGRNQFTILFRRSRARAATRLTQHFGPTIRDNIGSVCEKIGVAARPKRTQYDFSRILLGPAIAHTDSRVSTFALNIAARISDTAEGKAGKQSVSKLIWHQ
jgi:hypothetical protein